MVLSTRIRAPEEEQVVLASRKDSGRGEHLSEPLLHLCFLSSLAANQPGNNVS